MDANTHTHSLTHTRTSNGDIKMNKWEYVEWMSEWVSQLNVKKNQNVFATNFMVCNIFFHWKQCNCMSPHIWMYESVFTGDSAIFIFICAHIVFSFAIFPAIVYSYDILDVCQITTCCMQNMKPASFKLSLSNEKIACNEKYLGITQNCNDLSKSETKMTNWRE